MNTRITKSTAPSQEVSANRETAGMSARWVIENATLRLTWTAMQAATRINAAA